MHSARANTSTIGKLIARHLQELLQAVPSPHPSSAVPLPATKLSPIQAHSAVKCGDNWRRCQSEKKKKYIRGNCISWKTWANGVPKRDQTRPDQA